MSTTINTHRVIAESLKITADSSETITLSWRDDKEAPATLRLFLNDGETARQALEQLLNQVIAGIITTEINLESLNNK